MPSMVDRMAPIPKEVHIISLEPMTVTLCVKRDFGDVIKYLEIGLLSWIIPDRLNVIARIFTG